MELCLKKKVSFLSMSTVLSDVMLHTFTIMQTPGSKLSSMTQIHEQHFMISVWNKCYIQTLTSRWSLTFPLWSWPGSVLIPRTDQSVPGKGQEKKNYPFKCWTLFSQTGEFTVKLNIVPDVSHRPQAWWTWRPQLQRAQRVIFDKVFWPKVKMCSHRNMFVSAEL